MIPDDQLQALWEKIKKGIKSARFDPPLYRALDAAVCVTLDGTSLVLGYDIPHYSERSHLETPENRAAIQRVLARAASKPLELVVMEGVTVEDYARHQQHAAAAEALRQKTIEKAESRAAAAEGDDDDEGDASSANQLLIQVTRELHNGYRELSNRSQTYARAKFLHHAMAALAEAEDKLAGLEGSGLSKERQISRAIDRIANLLNADGLLVALEYERYKQGRG